MSNINYKYSIGIIYKIIVCLIMILSFVGLVGCSKRSADVPAINELSINSEQLLLEELKEFSGDDLHDAWGEPDWRGNGLSFDCWYIDGEREKKGDYIQVNYVDGKVSSVKYVAVFYATILEVHENHIFVMPVEGEWELNSSDKITVVTNETPEQIKEQFRENVRVRIGYNGLIMELYPAQIKHYFVEIEK